MATIRSLKRALVIALFKTALGNCWTGLVLLGNPKRYVSLGRSPSLLNNSPDEMEVLVFVAHSLGGLIVKTVGTPFRSVMLIAYSLAPGSFGRKTNRI